MNDPTPPPSAPKAEQVPQEVIQLIAEIRRTVFEHGGNKLLLNVREAAALIVAERERHSANLRDELKQTRANCADWIARENQLRREYDLLTQKYDAVLGQVQPFEQQLSQHRSELEGNETIIAKLQSELAAHEATAKRLGDELIKCNALCADDAGGGTVSQVLERKLAALQRESAELVRHRADLAREKERADNLQRILDESGGDLIVMLTEAELRADALEKELAWAKSTAQVWFQRLQELGCGFDSDKCGVWRNERAESAESRLAALQRQKSMNNKSEIDLAMDSIVNDFLKWPLPESVCCDPCANEQGKGRIGTNLMTHPETAEMVRAVVRPVVENLLEGKCGKSP